MVPMPTEELCRHQVEVTPTTSGEVTPWRAGVHECSLREREPLHPLCTERSEQGPTQQAERQRSGDETQPCCV
jgi:hypothetical protein